MAAPSLSIPAAVIGFDDTLAALGATNLQDAVLILLKRVEALEAAAKSVGLNLGDPAYLDLIPGL